MRRALLVWLIGAIPALAATERIGTWVLSCPPAGPCSLAYADPLLPMADGMTAELDVQRRGELLVPVIAMRGLSPGGVLGSVVAGPAVSLTFDSGGPVVLACDVGSGGVTCAPAGEGLAKAAAALPIAHSLTVKVSLNVPGVPTSAATGHTADRTIAIAGTQEALAQLRSHGAVGDDAPVSPGLDLKGMIDRTLRATGLRNGTADLTPWLMKLIGGRS
jgi:hypothetical protein